MVDSDRATGEHGAFELDRAAGEPGAAEVDHATGELGAAEEDRTARELGTAEVDHAIGELGGVEVDRAIGELGAAEDDRATGEPGTAEVDRAAGELGVVEADLASELGAAEADCAAGELGAAEADAVEDGAGEVEVQAAPVLGGGGPCGVGLEVGGDDADDGAADFAQGLERLPGGGGCVLAGVGLVGHAQVGAQDVDAGLALLGPVIGQPGHRVDPGQPHGGLVGAELPGRRGESLVQQPGSFAFLGPPGELVLLAGEVLGEFGDALAAVGGDQGHGAADRGRDRERYFQQVIEGGGG